MTTPRGPGAHDPGLRAVARVRGVREQDSRLGLQQALAEQREHERTVDTALQRIAATPTFTVGTSREFLADREQLAALGHALQAARDQVGASRTISAEAHGRWQSDRTRLAAVEMLLDRRAAERREAAARAEARELDELATQRWQRRAEAV